jgi:hypothetical protein
MFIKMTFVYEVGDDAEPYRERLVARIVLEANREHDPGATLIGSSTQFHGSLEKLGWTPKR